MKSIKRILAILLCMTCIVMPTAVFAEASAGETAARYIKAIINKVAEDYRFNADKQAMYESVLNYVMKANPELLEGAIDAAMDPLDAHSEYFPAQDRDTFIEEVEQVYVGIGVTIQKVDAGIEILEVNPAGGAYAAGIQVGDIIFEVEGTDITGKDTDEVSSMIKGEEGTFVTIRVHRGASDLAFTIERRLIQTETVLFEELDNKVAYIYISTFATSTVDSMERILADAESKGIKKLIIDVRDNPGGELGSVIDILSMFVPKDQTITKIEYNNARRNAEYKSTASFTKAPDRDIIVLVNENSASASELFAGCLQNLGLAKVVGQETFGKGSVQQFMGLINPDGFNLGDIKLTVAEFTKPDGGKINGLGISPDVRVKNAVVPYDDSDLTPMTLSAEYAVGSQADDVLAIEERLEVLGYNPGKVDGIFDEATKVATSVLQEKAGLPVTGIMNYTTQNALADEIRNSEMVEDRQLDTAYEMILKE